MKCTECNGTGKYVGLLKEELCKRCNGTGGLKLPTTATREETHEPNSLQFTTISFALDPELVLYEKPGSVHKDAERELDTTMMHSEPFRTKPPGLPVAQPTTMRTQVYIEPAHWHKLYRLYNISTDITITFPGAIPNNYLTFQGFVNSAELVSSREVINHHDGFPEALTIETGGNKLSVFLIDLGICLCPQVDSIV